MANGTSAILTGKPLTATGGVRFADVTATSPTDAKTALAEAFEFGGYVGEDGVTRSTDASDEKIKAWGGDTVKIVRTEHSISYTFQFLESANATVLKLINGSENVTIDDTSKMITVKQTGVIPPRKQFALDMADNEGRIRELIKDGQITSTGEVNFVHSDVIRYDVTIEAFPDEDGVKAVTFIEAAADAVAGG